MFRISIIIFTQITPIEFRLATMAVFLYENTTYKFSFSNRMKNEGID
jgi:hypothetical protein